MHLPILNYYTVSLLLGSSTALISGIIILLSSRRNFENLMWLLLTLTTSIWSYAYFLMATSVDKKFALLCNLILHYSAILIPLIYVVFVMKITNKFSKYKGTVFVLLTFALFYIFINGSNIFVEDIVQKVSFNFAPTPGLYYPSFFLYFISSVLIGILVCLEKILNTTNNSEKIKYFYLIFFTVCATLGGASVFLTTFFPQVSPYLIGLYPLYPVICTYAILKHQLLKTKIIAAHFIVLCLWAFILFRTLISESGSSFIANIFLLVISIALGVLLIKSVKVEIAQKDDIKLLYDSLQTMNRQLIEADDLKNKFVSLASHHIATPLTILKMSIWSIVENNNAVSQELLDDLHIAQDAVNRSTRIIGDFVDVLKIERGDEIYNKTVVSLRVLLLDLIDEMSINLQKKNLAIKTENILEDDDFTVEADPVKLNYAFSNIIDNYIRFSEKESLIIKIGRTSNNKIVLNFIDNIKRIVPEVSDTLRKKFSSTGEQYEANVLANDLGLFLAKQRITKHGGSFSIFYNKSGQHTVEIILDASY